MKKNVLKDKIFDFAVSVVKLSEFLKNQKKEYTLSNQILRSGTSIGALIRESEYAESKADFVHKMAIALKEANETQYWLELLYKSDYIDEQQFKSINTDSIEILKLLISIIKTTKTNQRRNN